MENCCAQQRLGGPSIDIVSEEIHKIRSAGHNGQYCSILSNWEVFIKVVAAISLEARQEDLARTAALILMKIINLIAGHRGTATKIETFVATLTSNRNIFGKSCNPTTLWHYTLGPLNGKRKEKGFLLNLFWLMGECWNCKKLVRIFVKINLNCREFSN